MNGEKDDNNLGYIGCNLYGKYSGLGYFWHLSAWITKIKDLKNDIFTNCEHSIVVILGETITHLLCFLVCTVHFREEIGPQFVLEEWNQNCYIFIIC